MKDITYYSNTTSKSLPRWIALLTIGKIAAPNPNPDPNAAGELLQPTRIPPVGLHDQRGAKIP